MEIYVPNPADLFPHALPDSVTVALRYPVEVTALELRRWLDIHMTSVYEAKLLGKTGPIHSLAVKDKFRDSWQARQPRWNHLLKGFDPNCQFSPRQLFVNFAERKDAMLFKLTWG